MKALLIFKLLICFVLHTGAQKFTELNDQFIVLFQKQEYTAALPFSLKALSAAEKDFGKAHLNYAISNYNVAETYYALEDWNASLPYYRGAIKTYAFMYKSGSAEIALCNNSIATVLSRDNKKDSAAQYYQKAFSFFILNASDNYDNMIVLMNNLSNLLLEHGKV